MDSIEQNNQVPVETPIEYTAGKNLKKFQYNNQQVSQNGGKKTIRKVSIKNGKGHKSVSRYSKGKRMSNVKIPLTIMEIVTIQKGKFIPGLFDDCKGANCK